MNLHEKYFEGKLIGEGYFFKVYIIPDFPQKGVRYVI